MSTLAELARAEDAADAQRRAVGRIPEHLREPDAARSAYARWEAAHEALTAARESRNGTGGRRMSAAFRVLLTGSRTWSDRAALERALDRQRAEHPGMILVHGACPEGAGQIGAEWAARNHVQQEPHPANWRPAGQAGRAAGFRRNTEMAASGPGVCISANKGNSSGTAHCTAEAAHTAYLSSRSPAGRQAGRASGLTAGYSPGRAAAGRTLIAAANPGRPTGRTTRANCGPGATTTRNARSQPVTQPNTPTAAGSPGTSQKAATRTSSGPGLRSGKPPRSGKGRQDSEHYPRARGGNPG